MSLLEHFYKKKEQYNKLLAYYKNIELRKHATEAMDQKANEKNQKGGDIINSTSFNLNDIFK